MRRRRLPVRLLAAPLLAAAMLIPATPQTAAAPSRGRPATLRGGPPHAWLFGTWTGGLFPVLEGMARQDCRTQPTVSFGQDQVGHASLTNPGMVTRLIETVRADPKGAEFRLTPDPTDTAGFGCDGADALHVAREADNTIAFPHCAAFPYPLERCPAG